jgi:hypothetical protein
MRRTPFAPVVALGLIAGDFSGVARAETPSSIQSPSGPPLPSGTIPVSGKPFAGALPRRHEGRTLVWDPAFNRMDAPEIAVTSLSVGIAVATAIARPLQTHWSGPILFDQQARGTLRLSSYQARLDARDISDVGLAIVTSFPILVDAIAPYPSRARRCSRT